VNELEQALLSVGRELDVPEPRDLAPSVLRALEPPVPRRLHRPRRLVLALAVLVLAALLATLAIPDARSGLLRFLRIGGEQIELVDELPEVQPEPAELDLGLALGERVSLEEARRRAGFDLLELDDAPDRVYIGARGTVWFLYGRPAAVRLLVAQTPAVRIDEPFILKKLARAGTRVDEEAVRGAPAYFLSGAPHVVMLVDERGVGIPETARLARNVLVWEEGGRTIRLEGDLTRADALALAESMR
jgi:hypothetical protein